MRLFDLFRKKPEPTTSEASKSVDQSFDFDPEAHHIVLEYLRKLWSGNQPDPIFEQKSLGLDLKFNSLNLAELFFTLSKERAIPLKRIVHFLRIGIPGGGDQKIANLLERIAILADGSFDESQRIVLLASGVVGDKKEIAPIYPEFDKVEFIIKYCRVIESLKSLQDHDAIDAEYGEVEEDPEWGK